MTERILIIGAGLGGLTAALALQKLGYKVQVFEQAPQLGEVGAGLTLSRGAQQVFRHLGLMELIAAKACRSAGFPFLHYRSGKILTGALEMSEGLPDDGVEDVSRQIHRADLHAVLSEAFIDRAPGNLFLGHSLVKITECGKLVTAKFSNGTSIDADLIIGADGVRSVVREQLFGLDSPRFTGQIAYRF